MVPVQTASRNIAANKSSKRWLRVKCCFKVVLLSSAMIVAGVSVAVLLTMPRFVLDWDLSLDIFGKKVKKNEDCNSVNA